MRGKKTTKKSGRKRIEFTFHAPGANEVMLFGDFNKWNGKKHSMKKGSLGLWKKTLVLAPGTYEYKYLVDGKWQEDPTTLHTRQNPFGTYNNLLTVE